MAGPQQVVRLRVIRNRNLDRGRLILGADARGHAKLGMGVDGDGEGGAELGGVGLRLRMQAQVVAALAGQGQADQSAAVHEHEIDRLRRDLLRRIDDVPLVFAVLVVHQHDGLTGLQFLHDLGDG